MSAVVRNSAVYLGLYLLALAVPLSGCRPTSSTWSPGASERGVYSSATVTFNRDLAPIIFEHCSPCHRPGEAAPFSLLTYADVKSHAEQIVAVTGSRFMPPWLPDPSVVRYANERLLTGEQIEQFRRWQEQGEVQGRAGDLPPVPQFTPGWQLGEPDLVLEMSDPFVLPADGPDVYRNFILPVELEQPRWVKAIEVRPGSPKVVHHAFVLADPTRGSRQLADIDSEPGFPGMDVRNVQNPAGHFISWQPGRMPRVAPDGMAWPLTPGTDLILQMHMQPAGKPETVQAMVGVFFTDQRPTQYPYKIHLGTTDIDIPAGEANFTIRDEYTLPVDLHVLAVSTHAHYLAKQMHAVAELPGGARVWLLKIDNWDLNWQGDYEFRDPIRLPKGTRLVQQFTYDNSEANIRNPSNPPRRVIYGPEATDEMASLWLQLLPRSREDYLALQRDYSLKTLQGMFVRYTQRLRDDPSDVQTLIELGKMYMADNRMADAEKLLERAWEIDSSSAAATYYYAHCLLRQGRADQAEPLLHEAARLNPRYFLPRHDLGMLHLLAGRMNRAADYFEQALQVNPYHITGLRNLAIVYAKLRLFDRAVEVLERAVAVAPEDEELAQLLVEAHERMSLGR